MTTTTLTISEHWVATVLGSEPEPLTARQIAYRLGYVGPNASRGVQSTLLRLQAKGVAYTGDGEGWALSDRVAGWDETTGRVTWEDDARWESLVPLDRAREVIDATGSLGEGGLVQAVYVLDNAAALQALIDAARLYVSESDSEQVRRAREYLA